MKTVVDGLKTSYLKVGKGKPIVLLHGWEDDSQTFMPLIEKLKQSYQVYALDFPGFGGTQRPSKEWDLGDYADFMKHWLDKLKLKPFALIGHSNGGAVAIVCSSRQKVTEKLILLGSTGIHNKRPIWKKIIQGGANEHPDIRPIANKVSVPTLLVYGSLDKQTPTADGHVLCRSIKGSRMEIIKAGHLLHRDDPEKVCRLIKEFLNDA